MEDDKKTITFKATTTEGIIKFLERVTAPDPNELVDPQSSGWGYILDMVETPRRPGGRILVKVQRQRSVVNNERDRLTIDCVPSYEDLNYFQIAPYFISIWNPMCKTFGSLEGQIKVSVPLNVSPEERDVWERILAKAPMD